jgi:hypothetical protein
LEVIPFERRNKKKIVQNINNKLQGIKRVGIEKKEE